MTDDPKRKMTLADMPVGLDYVEMLAKLTYFMTHCFRCDHEVEWTAEVCEACGNELMTHGKH